MRTLNLEAEHLIQALGEGVCWTKSRDNDKHVKHTIYERGRSFASLAVLLARWGGQGRGLFSYATAGWFTWGNPTNNVSAAVTFSKEEACRFHLTPTLSLKNTFYDIQTVSSLIKTPTVRWLLEVDIGISKRTPSNHVPTDPDRQDSPGRAEFLVQHGLGHVLVEVPDVQGGHGVTRSTGVHVSSAAGASQVLEQRTIRRRNFRRLWELALQLHLRHPASRQFGMTFHRWLPRRIKQITMGVLKGRNVGFKRK